MLREAIIGAGVISTAQINAHLKFKQRCKIVAKCDVCLDMEQSQIDTYGLEAVNAQDYYELLDTAYLLAYNRSKIELRQGDQG